MHIQNLSHDLIRQNVYAHIKIGTLISSSLPPNLPAQMESLTEELGDNDTTPYSQHPNPESLRR